jgi:hypothetical protein
MMHIGKLFKNEYCVFASVSVVWLFSKGFALDQIVQVRL